MIISQNLRNENKEGRTQKMNSTIQTIKQLHSTRNFINKNISEKDLEIILDSAISAGNSGNRQVYSIIVVSDRKLLKRFFYGGNKALIFLIDFNRWISLADHFRIDIRNSIDGLRGFTISSMDAMLAAQNAALAAQSLAIDSLFTTSLHRHDLDEIYEIFNLPNKFCFPYLSLVLGYADNPNISQKGRVKSGIIHEGKYNLIKEIEIIEQIKEYDKEEKHLAFLSKKDWQEKGYKHYLEFYFKNWVHPEPSEKIQKFHEKIKDSNFLKFL